jgi:hypothetical protein
MIETSTITCPKCGHQATEQMPIDACQFFYDCKGCGERLKPKPGDCVLFLRIGAMSTNSSWKLLRVATSVGGLFDFNPSVQWAQRGHHKSHEK